MADHPLDRPIWSALSTRQAALALGDARALRFAPDYGLFAAAADTSSASLAALAALVPVGGQIAIVEAERGPPATGAEVVSTAGDFIGVKDGGRLLAMAGERMKPDGFTEVSGVCTDPDHRGRGYAGALMRVVAARILARGETPFLHSYAHNTGVIGLYRSLGFSLRQEMTMTLLTRA